MCLLLEVSVSLENIYRNRNMEVYDSESEKKINKSGKESNRHGLCEVKHISVFKDYIEFQGLHSVQGLHRFSRNT